MSDITKLLIGPIRSSITKYAKKLDALLTTLPVDESKLTAIANRLDEVHKELEEKEQIYFRELAEEKATEAIITAAYDHAGIWHDSYYESKQKLVDYKNVKTATTTGAYYQSAGMSQSVQGIEKRCKLPKLEIVKFGGDVKDWLAFWGSFAKIDSDKGLTDDDKLAYLTQAMIVNSPAKRLVQSFPPSGNNYSVVVAQMKERFGRKDMLIEGYVRELLNFGRKHGVGGRTIELSELHDQLSGYLRALESLGLASDSYAAALYPMVEACLPQDIILAWQRSGKRVTTATFDINLKALMDFLREEVVNETRRKWAERSQSESQRKREFRSRLKTLPTATGLFSGREEKNKDIRGCLFCNKGHKSNECKKALEWTIKRRLDHIRDRKCCFQCLQFGHLKSQCRMRIKCDMCDGPHHTMMCFKSEAKQAASNKNDLKVSSADQKMEEKEEDYPSLTKTVGLSSLQANTEKSEVYLQTIRVRLNNGGKSTIVRAVLDSESQASYIVRPVVEALGYRSVRVETLAHNVFGGEQEPVADFRKFEVELTSLKENFKCKVILLERDEICKELPRIRSKSVKRELEKEGIISSDFNNSCNLDIHILLGTDILPKITTDCSKLIGSLLATKTKLGCVVSGPLNTDSISSSNSSLIASYLVKPECIQNFWKLETIGIMDSPTTQSRQELEESAVKHFRETVSINSDGRYVVCLPWLDNHIILPSNRQMAEKRLISTLKKVEQLKCNDSYQEVFDEWINQGVIERVSNPNLDIKCHYLPHRPVIKVDSATTKVRPVFDASSKVKGSPSLNDCLEKGPNLIEQLPGILIRFRMRRFGIVSDIKKAFLMLSVQETDRDSLRFLWRDNNGKVLVYRHCRVVFGVSSSPFLLAITIQHHLEKFKSSFPITCRIMNKSFYVDNLLVGVDDPVDIKIFTKNAEELMRKGKFELHDWHINGQVKTSENEIVPLLGINWNKMTDVFCLVLDDDIDMVDKTLTKRLMLSTMQKLFDPLGFMVPVSLIPKLLIQTAWQQKCSWDTELPKIIADRFREWVQNLNDLKKLKIPRLLCGNSFTGQRSLSLHVFCDSSKTAFATCAYLRTLFDGQVDLQLVMAKNRVCPLKPVTISRLELLGCLIGVRMANLIRTSICEEEVTTVFWTDSSNALAWIKREDQWAIFIRNRVNEILKSSDRDQWRHVPGNMNPADLPSRGCSASKLIEKRWFEGPKWLFQPENYWPNSCPIVDEITVNAETIKIVSSHLTSINEKFWYEKFSSYQHLLIVTCWCLRFINNLKIDANSKYRGLIKQEEVAGAEMILIKNCQEIYGKGSTFLKSYSHFVHGDGTIRIKSRIFNRADTEEFVCPVWLPFEAYLTKLIVTHIHWMNSHVGGQTLVSIVRERFWIPKVRILIRKIVNCCKLCRRWQAKPGKISESPLPIERVRESRTFEITGIDLAGPLYLKSNEKAWIVIFTCAIYRAVPLELISSCSTEAFLSSLRRFISRRGRPLTIFSDNGRNFLGAAKYLKSVDWTKISKHAAIERIKWKFNPPSAPWWGGFWERLIRSVKDLLKKVLGNASLDYEELFTVVTEIEAMINSRPLTFSSESPDDLRSITPLMFMRDMETYGTPDIDAADRDKLRGRYKHLQNIREQLISRFRNEYLGQLKNLRNSSTSTPLKVGDVVLINIENVKRVDWPLAKIIQVFSGRDGRIRVVKMRTSSGELTRPIQKVYRLEVDVSQQTDNEVNILSGNQA